MPDNDGQPPGEWTEGPGPGFIFAAMRPSKEDIENMRAHDQSIRHDLYRIFSEASEEHLVNLRNLLHACTDAPVLAEHFEGIAVGVLQAKHGYCIACGVNHDKEAEDLVAREAGPDAD